MKRVAHPGADAGPPSISEVLDLGALPLSESAPTESMHTDRVGTPGEWLAIVGKNLGHASRVLIGGRETKIRGHLAGGSILVKVPTGLSLESNDGVVVETPRGQTYAKLRLASYVLAADTDGDKVHIVRHSKKVAQEKPPFEEDIFEVGLRRAKFIALSPDHGVAYVIQTPKKKKKGDITISSSE
ncbi:hypothetical protein KAI87_17115, partial [Myxococcota bacterium]|nr:hypothetical protein [Myxococcota bacterium]